MRLFASASIALWASLAVPPVAYGWPIFVPPVGGASCRQSHADCNLNCRCCGCDAGNIPGGCLQCFEGPTSVHTGLDLHATAGTAVVAPFAGIVREARWHNGYGGVAIVESEDGTVSALLGHLLCDAGCVDPSVPACRSIAHGRNDPCSAILAEGTRVRADCPPDDLSACRVGQVGPRDRQQNGANPPHVHLTLRYGAYSMASSTEAEAYANERGELIYRAGQWKFRGYSRAMDALCPFVDPATALAGVCPGITRGCDTVERCDGSDDGASDDHNDFPDDGLGTAVCEASNPDSWRPACNSLEILERRRACAGVCNGACAPGSTLVVQDGRPPVVGRIAERFLAPDLAGAPCDNGGSAAAHDVYGVTLQDFCSPEINCPDSRGPEGVLHGGWAIAYNPRQDLARLIDGGFWGVYKCLRDGGHAVGGATLLGPPTDEEGEHADLPGVTSQHFERGYMWWDGRAIHVHLNDHREINEREAVSGCVMAPVLNNPPGPNVCEPSEEICNGRDDDMQGWVDEGCPEPPPPQTLVCYTTPDRVCAQRITLSLGLGSIGGPTDWREDAVVALNTDGMCVPIEIREGNYALVSFRYETADGNVSWSCLGCGVPNGTITVRRAGIDLVPTPEVRNPGVEGCDGCNYRIEVPAEPPPACPSGPENCNNGRDDDMDGFADEYEAGCSSPGDPNILRLRLNRAGCAHDIRFVGRILDRDQVPIEADHEFAQCRQTNTHAIACDLPTVEGQWLNGYFSVTADGVVYRVCLNERGTISPEWRGSILSYSSYGTPDGCRFSVQIPLVPPPPRVDEDDDGVSPPTDCDDHDARVRGPGTPENCDGADNNCDGVVDGFEQACGNGACAGGMTRCEAGRWSDCYRGGQWVPFYPFPEFPGRCGDGRDSDCDGLIDCADPDCAGDPICVPDCRDDDGDGYLTLPCGADCDDANPNVHPDAVEVCGNATDDDCNELVDENPPCECLEGERRACWTGVAALRGVGACVEGEELCSDGMWGACMGEGNPSAEFCDGVDNDCDGATDEDLGMSRCGAGACQRVVNNCIGGLPQPCVPGVPSAEVCGDAIDNDCDGASDENPPCACIDGSVQRCWTGDPVLRGVGVCTEGSQTCVAGAWGPCMGEGRPSMEICDGLDNDCDGAVDEGIGSLTCGVGECRRTVPSCIGGVPQMCTPAAPVAEICADGLDNDCDGAVDENPPCACMNGAVQACYVGDPRQRGIGDCVEGTQMCSGGAWGACMDQGIPSPELCDRRDNDCNGVVNDGLGMTSCGIGACRRTVQDCVGGVPQMCTPGSASPEACNGIDDDCDGLTDEDLGQSSCGIGDCVRVVNNCVGGAPQACVPGSPSPEICDSRDNNCNGASDDGIPSQRCGVGACERMEPGCVGGAVPACVPGAPVLEVCGDGVDNDCDGLRDEGNPEICDGLDNDCNCRIDEPCPNPVRNPAFNVGLTDWDIWVARADGYEATVTPEAGAGCDGSTAARIDVSAVNASDPICGGPCSYKVEFRQYGLTLEEGRRYRLAFAVRGSGITLMSAGLRQLCNRTIWDNCRGDYGVAPRCTDPCPAGVGNGNDVCCWEPYVREHDFAIAPTWRQVYWDFGPVTIIGDDVVRSDARVLFDVATAVGTVWIDDVHVQVLP